LQDRFRSRSAGNRPGICKDAGKRSGGLHATLMPHEKGKKAEGHYLAIGLIFHSQTKTDFVDKASLIL
jgi:hypothetical protein